MDIMSAFLSSNLDLIPRTADDFKYGQWVDIGMGVFEGYVVYPTVYGGDYLIFPSHSCCRSCIEQVVFQLQNDIFLERCEDCLRYRLICSKDGTMCTVCDVCVNRGLLTAAGEGGEDCVPVYGSGLFVYLCSFTVSMLVSYGFSDFI